MFQFKQKIEDNHYFLLNKLINMLCHLLELTPNFLLVCFAQLN